MSKKSIIWIIVLILCSVVVLSIVNRVIENNAGNNYMEKKSFTATVLENKGTSLLVEPDQGEDELSSSDKISVRVPQDGAVLKDLSEFTQNSKVKITYDGTIMESYPAQINAIEIEFNK